MEILYFLGLLTVFSLLVSLSLFKKEMQNKAKYKEFTDDAMNAIDDGFSKPMDLAHTSCGGISFRRGKDGEIKAYSQDRLCGTAIAH